MKRLASLDFAASITGMFSTTTVWNERAMCMKSAAPSGASHRSAKEKRAAPPPARGTLKKRTNYGGIPCGLLSHAQAKRTKEFGHRFIGPASGLNGCLQLAKLHVAKGQQDVVFAWEIVEKSALADVRGFRDVFDGGFGESSSGEKIQSGAEKTFTDFRTATLTTARSGVRCDGAVSKVRCR